MELLGVSAVGGNTDATTAQHCADTLLERLGSPLRCVPATRAGREIAGLPEGVHILALGPLTNLASALAHNPMLASRAQCTTVGGVMHPWRSPLLRFSCLNFRHDPRAAMAVTAAPWKRRLGCPLDVVKRLRMDARGLRRLAEQGNLGAYIAEHSWRWLRQAPLRHGRMSFPVWDLAAVMAAMGALPAARFSPDGGRLWDFDPQAAQQTFIDALADEATPPRCASRPCGK